MPSAADSSARSGPPRRPGGRRSRRGTRRASDGTDQRLAGELEQPRRIGTAVGGPADRSAFGGSGIEAGHDGAEAPIHVRAVIAVADGLVELREATGRLVESVGRQAEPGLEFVAGHRGVPTFRGRRTVVARRSDPSMAPAQGGGVDRSIPQAGELGVELEQ